MRKISMNTVATCGGIALFIMAVVLINNGSFKGVAADESAAVAKTAQTALALNANPSLVQPGGSATLVWHSFGFSSCSITGPSFSGSGLKGTRPTGPITTASTYVITCVTKNGGTSSQSVTVGIVPKNTSPEPRSETSF